MWVVPFGGYEVHAGISEYLLRGITSGFVISLVRDMGSSASANWAGRCVVSLAKPIQVNQLGVHVMCILDQLAHTVLSFLIHTMFSVAFFCCCVGIICYLVQEI